MKSVKTQGTDSIVPTFLDKLTVAQLFVIHYLLRKPEFHNQADKSGPVGTIQSHTNPIHSLTLNPS